MIENTDIYNIKIDIEKISTNEIYAGRHWRTRQKHKENYLILTNCFKNYDLIEDKVDIHIDFYFKGRALDSSNCSYMFKLIEDCLVKHKVLKDDTIKYVGKVSMQSYNKAKDNYAIIKIKKDSRINDCLITITKGAKK